MKHKFFTLLFAILASLGTMFAEKVQIGNLYYNLDASNQTAEVTSSGGDYSGAIVIPASVNYDEVEYHVTSIGSSAFRNCSGLASVTIPNSVTSIGDYAFYYCSGLASLEIPNSVTSIGDGAFTGCSGLTSPIYNAHVFACMPTSYSGAYTIPDGIESIAPDAFYECIGLTSVTIPNSVASIGDWAFSLVPNIVYSGSATGSPWGAKSVNGYVEGFFVYSDDTKNTLLACFLSAQGEIEIPNSVTSIGDFAFYYCSGLNYVEIPNSVTSIGEQAFYYCSGLTSVTIPNSVTSIGWGAFYGCSGLTFVTIGNSVTNIGDYAFHQCFSLTSVTIPNSVTSIGDWAFMGCLNLTSITIPESVTSIGEEAFYWCTGLTSVTCEAVNPPYLGDNVFYNIDKSIPLYVPKESVSLYQTAYQWEDFTNIIGFTEPVETQEKNINVVYLDKTHEQLHSESVTFNLPIAPVIEGFTFVRWTAKSDNIQDGIILQAIYQANTPTAAPEVYTNPANKAQKLIKNGNVYILRDDKTYTLTGQAVK